MIAWTPPLVIEVHQESCDPNFANEVEGRIAIA